MPLGSKPGNNMTKTSFRTLLLGNYIRVTGKDSLDTIITEADIKNIKQEARRSSSPGKLKNLGFSSRYFPLIHWRREQRTTYSIGWPALLLLLYLATTTSRKLFFCTYLVGLRKTSPMAHTLEGKSQRSPTYLENLAVS